METKIRKLIKLIGSRWTFRLTLLVFTAETGWLALTSRFPMAYDEAYHFGLIRFFAHRLNPIVTSQPPDTYRFGALVHNPPFLYHYLLSFADRFINLFTGSMEVQAICLRFINVAFAVAGLLVVRKLLKLMRLSDALANMLVLALALTPMMTVVSAQINYDNLLIPAVSLCVYEAILFIRQLDKGRFDARRFLILLNLCLFSSLIKSAFLPVFVAIAAVVIWKTVIGWRQDSSRLRDGAKRSFAGIPKYVRAALVSAVVLGSLLFAWFYLVNTVEYHNPVPQCTQALSVRDCEHYPPWDYLYKFQRYYEAHPAQHHLGPVQYGTSWLIANTFQLFGTQIPLEGTLNVSLAYLLIVLLIGTVACICALVNSRKILRENPDFLILMAVSLVYLLCLWAWNYQAYLRIGLPQTAVHGRYILPVLIYIYVGLAAGLRYSLKGRGMHELAVKTSLALLVILSFIYYGGFVAYIRYVDPAYGRLSSANRFISGDAATGK